MVKMLNNNISTIKNFEKKIILFFFLKEWNPQSIRKSNALELLKIF